MNYRQALIFTVLVFSFEVSFAKITALFHPYDSTLQQIATWAGQAQTRIDIAMYNMETSKKSPVIALLSSPEMQEKIQTKKLQVRLVFEGYGTPEDNAAKMSEIEKLGVDVRLMGSSKKVHHKFAVIDSGSSAARLVVGSANWSLSSQNNYNENILFADREYELANAYQQQFELLWTNAKEFGADLAYSPSVPSHLAPRADAQPYFNSDNFLFTDKGIRNNTKIEGYRLTRQIVRVIDQAESKIEIASTRFKLRPVYEALVRAANRGVKVQMVISMDDYDAYWIRAKATLKDCVDIYEESCSSGTSFGGFLTDLNHPNIEVRIKYYDLNHNNYILKQMHSKYMVVDGDQLLTGSFNWSVSSEYGNIESLIEIQGAQHADLLAQYNFDFTRLWNMGRDNYASVLQSTLDLPRGSQTTCALAPMVITYAEVDALVKAFQGKSCGKSESN